MREYSNSEMAQNRQGRGRTVILNITVKLLILIRNCFWIEGHVASLISLSMLASKGEQYVIF